MDLSQAYAQLSLCEESKKLCVISTHRGLFAYQRLPFGVSSAPAIWQRTIEQVLTGINGIVCYFDDVLVCGKTRAEHDARLRQVLSRFDKFDLRLSKDKCDMYKPRVNYLGYVVSNEGLHPDPNKVVAIKMPPSP